MSSPPRLDRDSYLATGFDLLARHGPGALTIVTLCQRLRVTRGSFYHHFADLPAFTDALVDDWEATMRRQLDVVGAVTDPYARFEATAKYTLNEIPHGVEAALRAWTFSNPVAAAAVRRMDRARELNYGSSCALVIDDPERCARLAHMGVELLIGLQQAAHLDRAMFVRVGLEWTRRNVGLTADLTSDPDGALALRVLTLPPPRRPTG